VFHDPITAEIEVALHSQLSDPTEATRLSGLLRNHLLIANEQHALAWPEVVCAYRRLLERAAAESAACRAKLAADAAAVLGGAPETEIRAAATAMLELGRGSATPGVSLESP
jgi:hypothetical protein